MGYDPFLEALVMAAKKSNASVDNVKNGQAENAGQGRTGAARRW
jgi:hypothetical protein